MSVLRVLTTGQVCNGRPEKWRIAKYQPIYTDYEYTLTSSLSTNSTVNTALNQLQLVPPPSLPVKKTVMTGHHCKVFTLTLNELQHPSLPSLSLLVRRTTMTPSLWGAHSKDPIPRVPLPPLPLLPSEEDDDDPITAGCSP